MQFETVWACRVWRLTDLGSEDVKAVTADRLLAGETGHLPGGTVERGDAAVVIGREYAVCDTVKDDGRDSAGGRFHVVICLVMVNAARMASGGLPLHDCSCGAIYDPIRAKYPS
jgi:hypothetical protein